MVVELFVVDFFRGDFFVEGSGECVPVDCECLYVWMVSLRLQTKFCLAFGEA